MPDNTAQCPTDGQRATEVLEQLAMILEPGSKQLASAINAFRAQADALKVARAAYCDGLMSVQRALGMPENSRLDVPEILIKATALQAELAAARHELQSLLMCTGWKLTNPSTPPDSDPLGTRQLRGFDAWPHTAEQRALDLAQRVMWCGFTETASEIVKTYAANERALALEQVADAAEQRSQKSISVELLRTFAAAEREDGGTPRGGYNG